MKLNVQIKMRITKYELKILGLNYNDGNWQKRLLKWGPLLVEHKSMKTVFFQSKRIKTICTTWQISVAINLKNS
jgi:hypothetical protein